MLSVPPPTRVALGTLQIGGQRVELFASAEWARYFQSLNNEVLASAGAVVGSAQLTAMLVDATGDEPDRMPSQPGPRGEKGEPGPALFLLQDDVGEQQMLMPPAIGNTPPSAGSFTTLTSTAGFGCNGKPAQTAAVSGGTLAGVIAALVANGILSS